MRIIAGKYKSRKIYSPDVSGLDARPTSDRARETIFNMLSVIIDFEDVTVLDLYAGTGAFGFEALSRGADIAFFVDRSKKSRALIEKTAASLDAEDDVEVFSSDVFYFLNTVNGSYDIIFADPPYDFHDYNKLIKSVLNLNFQIFILEYRHDAKVSEEMIDKDVYEINEKNVGKSNFKFLIKKD